MAAEVVQDVELLMLSTRRAANVIRSLTPKLLHMLTEYEKERESEKTMLAFLDVLGLAVTFSADLINEVEACQPCVEKLATLLHAVADRADLPLPGSVSLEMPRSEKN